MSTNGHESDKFARGLKVEWLLCMQSAHDLLTILAKYVEGFCRSVVIARLGSMFDYSCSRMRIRKCCKRSPRTGLGELEAGIARNGNHCSW